MTCRLHELSLAYCYQYHKLAYIKIQPPGRICCNTQQQCRPSTLCCSPDSIPPAGCFTRTMIMDGKEVAIRVRGAAISVLAIKVFNASRQQELRQYVHVQSHNANETISPLCWI